jgi:hypothetical protein
MSGWEIFIAVYLILSIVSQLIFTVIVSVGGAFDLRYLFRKLNEDAERAAKSEPPRQDDG